MAEIQVKGLSELLENLKALPAEVASKNGGPLRSALFQATKLIREDAKRRAPRQTGNLESNIIMVRDRRPGESGATERYLVSVRARRWTAKRKAKAKRTKSGRIDFRGSGDAYYWRYVEFGTEKMRAEPFLRPAFEGEKSAAVEAFRSSLAIGIQRIVKRLGKS